jgi:dihydroflavonol-4-reductase
MIDQTRTGKLKMRMFPDAGFNFVHVEDVADGILLAHDKGRIGESYNLAGEKHTIGDLVDKTAELVGRKPPSVTMPAAMIKLAIPVGPAVGKLMGFPPNLAELIKTSDGVTFWMTDQKARDELGFSPRDFDSTMRETVNAA